MYGCTNRSCLKSRYSSSHYPCLSKTFKKENIFFVYLMAVRKVCKLTIFCFVPDTCPLGYLWEDIRQVHQFEQFTHFINVVIALLTPMLNTASLSLGLDFPSLCSVNKITRNNVSSDHINRKRNNKRTWWMVLPTFRGNKNFSDKIWGKGSHFAIFHPHPPSIFNLLQRIWIWIYYINKEC